MLGTRAPLPPPREPAYWEFSKIHQTGRLTKQELEVIPLSNILANGPLCPGDLPCLAATRSHNEDVARFSEKWRRFVWGVADPRGGAGSRGWSASLPRPEPLLTRGILLSRGCLRP